MLCGKYAPISIRKSDKSYYIAYNMHWNEHLFELPILPKGKKWRVIVDTSELQLDFAKEEKDSLKKGISSYLVKPRTIVVFEELD